MSTLLEIESAIEMLPPKDQQELRDWLLARPTAKPPVQQKLRALAGAGRNLPADFAANHDHYLHGTSKLS